jgi:hypothetical protein
VNGDATQIPNARDGGTWPSVTGCLGNPATSCTHTGGLPAAAGELLFYQVRGLCDGTEAPE